MPDRDDHVDRETRALSALIVPFLVTAFVVLYLFPNDTGRLFAWPLAPSVTSFLLASAYIGGAYFFVRVIFESCWHHVSVGFLPVATFATLMMIATLLHWDKFSHRSIAFWAWVAIYAITPFLVLGAWLHNRRTDPGTPDSRDVRIPPVVRWALGASGALVLAVGLVLFAAPGVLATVWPWPITPLSARVVASCFALTGTFGICIFTDRRWTSARIPLQSLAVSLPLILIGSARAWGTLDQGNAFTWVFVGGLGAFLAALIVVYVILEMRLSSSASQQRS